jgi:hypothetical protein
VLCPLSQPGKRRKVKRSAEAVAEIVEDWISNESHDLVLAEFGKLESAATTLPSTDKAIFLAQRRKALGNPPTSPNKYTIGDEVIWETLLAQAAGDLIIVSRDATFLDNQELLRREYERSGSGSRHLLLVTRSLRDALARVAVPSVTIDEVEADLEETDRGTVEQMDPWKTKRCPVCNEEMVEEGLPGPGWRQKGWREAWWLECPRCGFVAPLYRPQ